MCVCWIDETFCTTKLTMYWKQLKVKPKFELQIISARSARDLIILIWLLHVNNSARKREHFKLLCKIWTPYSPWETTSWGDLKIQTMHMDSKGVKKDFLSILYWIPTLDLHLGWSDRKQWFKWPVSLRRNVFKNDVQVDEKLWNNNFISESTRL